jgi:hypothetical protein
MILDLWSDLPCQEVDRSGVVFAGHPEMSAEVGGALLCPGGQGHTTTTISRTHRPDTRVLEPPHTATATGREHHGQAGVTQ